MATGRNWLVFIVYDIVYYIVYDIVYDIILHIVYDVVCTHDIVYNMQYDIVTISYTISYVFAHHHLRPLKWPERVIHVDLCISHCISLIHTKIA